jgi:hypothetical protein
VNAPASVAASAEPGSIADLVALYTPPAARGVLRALLAVESEIRASAQPGLDHTIAHVRLDWWRQEIERTLEGQAAHPLTRELSAALAPTRPDLTPMLLSTQLELTGLAGADESHWRIFFEGGLGTVFRILAQAMGSTASPATLGRWGGLVQQLTMEREAPPPLLAETLQSLTPAMQPQLRPLLVWTALVGWRCEQRVEVSDESAPPGLRLALAQQWLAWRSARAADAGTFRWRWSATAA